jgi:hypothetical protein
MTQLTLTGQPIPRPSESAMKERDRLMQETLQRAHDRWRTGALRVMEDLAAMRDTFCADDWRDECLRRGVGEPPHPNAWGALAQQALNTHVIRRTGETTASRRKLARGRALPVWESGNGRKR